MAFSVQVFEDTQASDSTSLYVREQSRELQAVNYGDDSQSNTPVGTPATENFYQAIYDAFMNKSVAPQLVQDAFDPAKMPVDAKETTTISENIFFSHFLLL